MTLINETRKGPRRKRRGFRKKAHGGKPLRSVKPQTHPAKPAEIASLEKRLKIKFKNKKLLEQALTHPSYPNKENADNGRLEFLGDSFLGLVISHLLYERNQKAPEGELTRLKSHLVSTKFLHGLAEFLDLGKYLRSVGQEATASMLAATFEAVVGALFLDGGYQKAYRFLEDLFHPHLKITEAQEENYKGFLQELLQRKYKEQPHYEVVGEHGPDHSKVFEVKVLFRGKVFGIGKGNSKKEAEKEAAREALAILGRE